MRLFRGQLIESDAEWASRMVAPFPVRWARNMLAVLGERKTADNDEPLDIPYLSRAANENLSFGRMVQSLSAVRVPLDATDGQLCQAADELAARCFSLAQSTMAGQKPGPYRFNPVFGAEVRESATWGSQELMRAALARVAEGQGVTPPMVNPGKKSHVEDGPAVARMIDPQWWRRGLRRMHAKNVEGAAISLGYVNRSRDRYASNESVIRRGQQNRRNAESMEATIATNEQGDEYTLAELAALGPANKAIRRAELMTRIVGFERVALDLGHVGVFMTMTCPSRMHKWGINKQSGGVFENPRYDGTLPGDAQKHLAAMWSQARAAAARKNIKVYGFRIAEPNHDATPHWHMLFFMPSGQVEQFTEIMWRYALKDSPSEPGATSHRLDVKPIEAGKGTAAGYIAKYVAKNIDGFALRSDLCGGQFLEADSATTAQRVDAWASTWNIRQFQQIGGPPVGVWRELRRVEHVPDNAPVALREAHVAVNSAKWLHRSDVQAGHDMEDADKAGAAWDRYVMAQGGPVCGRAYPVRVTMVEQGGENKYGEEKPKKPVGVEHPPTKELISRGYKLVAEITVQWFVESVRHAWTIVRSAGKFLGAKAKPLAPWTCVNNCTDPGEKTAPEFVDIGRNAQWRRDYSPDFCAT